MGLSVRKYAEHRKSRGLPGGSHTAVRKAILDGRIQPEPDGTLDPLKCDTAWGSNTVRSPSKEESKEKRESISTKVPKGKSAQQVKDLDARQLQAGLETLKIIINEIRGVLDDSEDLKKNEVEKVKEIYLVLQRKLEYEKKAGNLVEVEPIRKYLFEIWQTERDAWLNWPARVSAIMAAELGVDSNELAILLEKHVNEHLAERSDQPPRLRLS